MCNPAVSIWNFFSFMLFILTLFRWSTHLLYSTSTRSMLCRFAESRDSQDLRKQLEHPDGSSVTTRTLHDVEVGQSLYFDRVISIQVFGQIFGHSFSYLAGFVFSKSIVTRLDKSMWHNLRSKRSWSQISFDVELEWLTPWRCLLEIESKRRCSDAVD